MENSPVVPGSPYFIMTYDTAKKLTGITEQTGILAVKNSDGHLALKMIALYISQFTQKKEKSSSNIECFLNKI